MALIGTNQQAAAAKRKLFNDPDEDVARAGRHWRPAPCGKRYRAQRSELEADFRADPDRWTRYQEALAELVAWNWLESAVTLALSASLVGVIAVLMG